MTLEDLLLVCVTFVWGANFSVIKAALAEMSPLAFNGIRFSLAAGVLLLIQWLREGLAPVRPYLGRLVLLGLVGNLVYQLLFVFGLDSTRAGQAALFTSTTPVFTFFIGGISGHDRVDRRAGFGVLLTTVGVVALLHESLVGAWSAYGFWVGDLMLLGSACCWALYTVYSQPLLGRIRPLALTSVSMAAGGVPLLLVALPDVLGLQFRQVSLAAWVGLGYSSLLALVFSYVVWYRAVRRIGSTRAAAYLNLVPVIGVAIAWWWLEERLTAVQGVGAAAVVLGVYLSRTGRRLGRGVARTDGAR